MPRPAWAAALLALTGACSGGDATADRPHLILVSLDTCRADRLGCYGAERGSSPNLDAFAEEAAVFTDCLTASTVTGPSHRSLFTSHRVRRHGVLRNGHPSRSPYTLAELVKAAGWRTAAVTGGGPMHQRFGLDQGFDHYEQTAEMMNAHDGLLGLAVDSGLEWLDERPGEPGFLFLHGFDPHCPYTPPEETRGRFGSWYSGGFTPESRCGAEGFGPLYAAGEFGADEERFLRDLYDEEILAADAAFGRLIEGLRSRGLLDRSIVIFVSDHGENLGEHQWVGHARLWEEQLRVPFLIRFPGGRWAGRRDEPVELIDLLPSLLSYLEIAPPPGLQGIDLMPALRAEGQLPQERMRAARTGQSVTVRFGPRWKLMFRWEKERKAWRELYDLAADPQEQENLYATPEGKDIAHGILRRYQSWIEETAEADRAYAAVRTAEWVSPEDRAALAALGYAEGEIDPGEPQDEEPEDRR